MDIDTRLNRLVTTKKVKDGIIADLDGLDHRGQSPLHGRDDNNGVLADRAGNGVPASDAPLCIFGPGGDYQIDYTPQKSGPLELRKLINTCIGRATTKRKLP